MSGVAEGVAEAGVGAPYRRFAEVVAGAVPALVAVRVIDDRIVRLPMLDPARESIPFGTVVLLVALAIVVWATTREYQWARKGAITLGVLSAVGLVLALATEAISRGELAGPATLVGMIPFAPRSQTAVLMVLLALAIALGWARRLWVIQARTGLLAVAVLTAAATVTADAADIQGWMLFDVVEPMQGLTAVITMILALAVPAAQPDQWPLGGLLRTPHERVIVDALLPWIVAVPFVPALTARAGTIARLPEGAVVVASALAPTLVLLGALGAAVRTQRRLGDRLDVAMADLRLTLEQSPIGIAVIGADGQFLRVNDSLCRLLCRDRASLLADGVGELVHPDDFGVELDLARRCLEGERDGFRVTQRFRHGDGHWIPTEVSVSLVRHANGQPLHFVAQVVDMTEQRRIQSRLQDAAVRDILTGLVNRRGVEQHLARLAANRDEGTIGIVYLDLDRFKEVNDTYGHAAGDDVLRAVGRRLQDLVRADDVVGRIGGDEFVIVCGAPDPQVIHDVTERVRVALADGIDVAVNPDVVVRCQGSVGTVLVDVDEQLADALERADRAMYDAKQARALERA